MLSNRSRFLERTGQRGLTTLEGAIAFAVIGSLLVIFGVSFKKNWRSSRLVEAVDGLEAIQTRAIARSESSGLPASAPLTPAEVPRAPIIDPEGAWAHETWTALEFRAAPEGVPHSYAFIFEAGPSEFVARAHGDLDGDGVSSTFELRGVKKTGRFEAVRGMRVVSELE